MTTDNIDYPELTLEILNEAIQKIVEQQEIIVGVSVSPSDYLSLRDGGLKILGWDSSKIFEVPLYKGMVVFVSEMVEDGKPIPLVRKRKESYESV